MSLAFVRGIHRRPSQRVRKCFHLMTSSWLPNIILLWPLRVLPHMILKKPIDDKPTKSQEIHSCHLGKMGIGPVYQQCQCRLNHLIYVLRFYVTVNSFECLNDHQITRFVAVFENSRNSAKYQFLCHRSWISPCMMTPSNGNIFRVTGPLCGEFTGEVTGPLCGELTGHRWNAFTKVSDAELWCFFDLRLE